MHFNELFLIQLINLWLVENFPKIAAYIFHHEEENNILPFVELAFNDNLIQLDDMRLTLFS